MAISLSNPSTALVVALTGRDTPLADTGNAYTAITPTPGTGIVSFATPTTYAVGELNPFLYVFNGGQANIFPAYLRLTLTVVPTTNTSMRFAIFVDQNVNRRTDATATALTPNNSQIPSTNKSAALISVGTNVLSAALATRRTLSDTIMRPVIGVVLDSYEFTWGAIANVQNNLDGGATNGVLVNNVVKAFTPIALGPNASMGVVFWAPAITVGATFAVEFGYYEK